MVVECGGAADVEGASDERARFRGSGQSRSVQKCTTALYGTFEALRVGWRKKRRRSGASSLCSLKPEAASSLCHAITRTMAAVDFSYLQDALTRDAELRERVRDVVRQLEQAQRASLAVLARVHSCPDSQSESLARDRQLP